MDLRRLHWLQAPQILRIPCDWIRTLWLLLPSLWIVTPDLFTCRIYIHLVAMTLSFHCGYSPAPDWGQAPYANFVYRWVPETFAAITRNKNRERII